MNKDLQIGKKMISPMFQNVGASSVTKLSDLTVTGYPEFDPDAWEGGCSGDVDIQILDAYGKVATDDNGNRMVYSWFDDGDTEDMGLGAGWYINGIVSEANKVDADKVIFDQGAGLWMTGTDVAKVVCAGQVLLAGVNFPLRDGKSAAGNPYAVTRTLANYAVTGYPEFDPDAWEGGCSGDVDIQILDAYGKVATDDNGNRLVYSWFDDGDTEDMGLGAGWYINGIVSEANKVDAEKVAFNAGDGLWVTGKGGWFLNIQAPEL